MYVDANNPPTMSRGIAYFVLDHNPFDTRRIKDTMISLSEEGWVAYNGFEYPVHFVPFGTPCEPLNYVIRTLNGLKVAYPIDSPFLCAHNTEVMV